ncbi:MAG: DUF268 domain-containing protein [Bacteroidota bacterium]|nr:DUF268 domain-containing protein [Bacteroidota bacterium]
MLLQKIIKKIRYEKNRKLVLRRFRSEFDYFNSMDSEKRLKNDWEDIFPCLYDNLEITPFDSHYVYHPAWAARIIKEINPVNHIDISSSLHFCTMLSAFIPTEFYDYRPANLTLSSLTTGKADLTNLFFESESVESISCMHTIEHIGLGRYGDAVDPDGDLKAIKELQRVVKRGGSLLLVTPVGQPKIQYNAHRIYSFELINSLFGEFELKNFSLIDDRGTYIQNAKADLVKDLFYGCGCFWYVKK